MTSLKHIVSFIIIVVVLLPSIAAFPFDWTMFPNLTDCHPGQTNPFLPDMKQYLQHFGYIDSQINNFTEAFDEDLEKAVRVYQENLGLQVTGVLDFDTIEKMMLPRCGVADIINGTSSMHYGKFQGRHLYAYFPGNPTWPKLKRDLTYAVTTTSAVSLDPSVVRKVFARAFSRCLFVDFVFFFAHFRWSEATNLNFTEVTSSASEPDITIGFYRGDHGDGEPFDGVLGTLAHAFSPTDGRFHLDAAEDWVADGDLSNAGSSAVDLESVAVHEIGHLLGLGHSSVEEAIMYPTIRTRTKKVELAKDDVQGVQNLYGSNPNYGGAAPSTTGNQRETNGGGVGLRGGMVEIGLIFVGLVLLCL